MRRTRIGLRWVVITLAIASFFCASTTFVSTWRAPDARPLRLTGRKVVAIFMGRSPAARRRAEDAMAREISARGAQGVPSYTVLSDEEVKDKDGTHTAPDNDKDHFYPHVIGSARRVTHCADAPGGGFDCEKVLPCADGEDTIAIRTCAYFSISFDHRVIDGAIADQFLAFVKKTIETFPETGL